MTFLLGVAVGGVVAGVALGAPVAEHVRCPSRAAVARAGFAGDGVAGAGAAEAVGLVVAEVPGGGGDPSDQATSAARGLLGGVGVGGRGGVPGRDTGQVSAGGVCAVRVGQGQRQERVPGGREW